MRRFTFILSAFLILGVLDLQAQQAPENFLGITVEEGVWEKDSVKATGDSSESEVAEMPIYNPQDVNSKILIHKPEGIYYNMPVIGKENSLFSRGYLSDSGKNLFKKGPSDNNEEEKDNSAEQK